MTVHMVVEVEGASLKRPVWRWPTPTPALDHTLRGGQSHEQVVALVFAQTPRSMAAISAPTSQASPSSLPPSVFTLPQTAQLEALYTIIRDKNTSRADFLFYSDRIIRLLVEEGLNHLPVLPKTVETPTVRSLHDAAACAAEHGRRARRTMASGSRARSAACPSSEQERCVDMSPFEQLIDSKFSRPWSKACERFAEAYA
jgi:hypothetical protein